MKDITKETFLTPGNIIYNPIENVRYKVNNFTYNIIWRKHLAYLEPLPPFKTSKNGFSITVEDMIKLGYQIETNQNPV